MLGKRCGIYGDRRVHQTVPRFYTGKLQAVQAQPQFTITYFISIYNIKISIEVIIL